MKDKNLLLYQEELQKYLNETESIDYDMIFGEYGIDLKELESEFENYRTKLDLGWIKLHPDAVKPKYNYDGDSGFDLHSVEEVIIPSFGRALIPTGIALDIKDGYEIQVRTKSGLALKQGLIVLNSPGTVDNQYTGEIKVILMNMNNYSITIEKGMKVAQAVLAPVVNGKWVNLIKQDKIEDKARGANGFGSTGIK